MAKYLDIDAALKAGYSQDEIDQFMKSQKLAPKPRVNTLGATTDQPLPVVSQPAMPTTPEMPMEPESLNTRVGKTIMNVGNKIISPFVRTGRNIAGATIQAPLALRAADLANIVNDESKPEEERDKALKELRRVNSLNRLIAPWAESGKVSQPYAQTPQDVITSPEVAQQARDSVNVASYAVPFGKGANFLTKAVVPGAAVGAMQEVSEKGATPESIVGAAVTGGSIAGLLHGAMKVPGALRKGGKVVENAGTAVRSGSSPIYLRANVGGAQREEFVQKTLDGLGIRGTAAQKYKQLQPVMEKLTDQIDDVLTKSPKKVRVDQIVDDFMKNLDDALLAKELTQKEAKKEVGLLIQEMYKKANKGSKVIAEEISTTDLFRFKKQLNKIVSGIYDKIERGTPLNAREKVLVQARQTLDDIIAVAHPRVKELTRKQSALFDAADSLSAARKTVPTFRAFGTTVPKGLQQGITDLAGSTMQKTGKAMSSIPNPKINEFLTGQLGVRAGLGASNFSPDPGYNTEDQGQQISTGNNDNEYGTNPNSQVNHTSNIIPYKSPTGYSTAELRTAVVGAIRAGDKKAEAAARELLAVEEEAIKEHSNAQKDTIEKKAGTASERKTLAQVKNGQRAIGEIKKMLEADPSLLAKSALTPFKALSRKYENAAYRAAEALLRIQTGAVVTKAEAQAYAEQYMPWFGDDPETIKYKLEQLDLDYESFTEMMQ